MKHSMEKFTWHSWVVLSVSWTAFAVSTDSCRRPEITSNSSLFVYQRADTVNVVVYHCLYFEENVCDKDICSECTGKLRAGPVIKESIYRYSDITQKCLNAFNKTVMFVDKYGYSHDNNKRSDFYTCDNATANLNRTISVTLSNNNASADIARDKIFLKSGTACRYSSGFCHDKIEDVDVVWRVEDLTRYEWKKFNVSDLYFLVLNKKPYAIIESHGKYYILELKNQSQNSWETQYEGLIVCTTIEHASNGSLEMIDHLELSFENKQDMYDFITEKCDAELHKANSSQLFSALFDRTFLTALKMRRQENHLQKLNVEYQLLKFHLTICFYVINVVVCLAILLVCCICQKSFTVANKNVPDCSKPVANDGEYTYITSEYDRNSIYVLCEKVK